MYISTVKLSCSGIFFVGRVIYWCSRLTINMYMWINESIEPTIKGRIKYLLGNTQEQQRELPWFSVLWAWELQSHLWLPPKQENESLLSLKGNQDCRQKTIPLSLVTPKAVDQTNSHNTDTFYFFIFYSWQVAACFYQFRLGYLIFGHVWLFLVFYDIYICTV